MLRTFIQVLALTTVLISSIFLIRGTISLSKKDLAELSSTKFGYNLDVTKNLCRQRADYVIGFVLLLLSFFLQLGNMLWPMTIDDIGGINKGGIWLALITTLFIWLISNIISNRLYANQYNQVESILKKIE